MRSNVDSVEEDGIERVAIGPTEAALDEAVDLLRRVALGDVQTATGAGEELARRHHAVEAVAVVHYDRDAG